MGKTKPLGLLLGLAGNAAIAWGLYHLMEIGSCGDVGQPSCPADAWPYFVALPVGIIVSILSIFLGGGAFIFGGVFLAVGIGSLAAGIWGDNEETQTFALIFGAAFTFFGLLPLVGGLLLRPMAKAKLEKAERLVATGGRGIGTVIEVSDTGITINDNPRVHLRMRIEPSDGSAPFEREKTVTVSRVAIPRAGDRFPVFYDREDPSNWGYGTEMEPDAPADIRELFEAANAPGVQFGAPTAVPAASPVPSPLDEIARLNDLRLKGAVTDEEFEEAKDRLLAQLGNGTVPPPAA
jgi:membrane protein implicated in regulation of membrane protease activity